MYTLHIDVEPELSDTVSAWLFEAGAAGLEERGTELIVYAPDRVELERIEAFIFHRLTNLAKQDARAKNARLDIGQLPDETWKTRWTEYLKPVAITETIIAQPVASEAAHKAGYRVLLIDPKPCFGVGSHPTTQLCARSVERYCREHSGSKLLDVGCGTGILAMVGLLNGAFFAQGVDNDPVAISAAHENARLNAMSERSSFSGIDVQHLVGVFDVVVANLDEPTLLSLATELGRLTRPGGMLIVSGFLLESTNSVARVLASIGLVEVRRAAQGDFGLLEVSASSS